MKRCMFVIQAMALLAAVAQAQPIVEWKLDNLKRIGGHPVKLVGEPQLAVEGALRSIAFDGVDDAVLLDADPVAGLTTFTLEIYFRPEREGPAEQRFLHIQEKGSEDRMMVETRLDGGEWWLDSYVLRDGQDAVLIDPAKRHPVGPYYHVAVVYDGQTLSHYVNGVLERSAPVKLRPLREATTSIGVRQNRVHWYKGRIAWMRATPRALPPAAFTRPRAAGSGPGTTATDAVSTATMAR